MVKELKILLRKWLKLETL